MAYKYRLALDNAATMLFAVWQSCQDCQGGAHVCDRHQYLIEPVLTIVGANHGVPVERFRVKKLYQ